MHGIIPARLTRASVIVENAIDLALERDVPDILCSALTQDCIGRGKTIKEGGAVYDYISGLQVGIANMADSLAAIKSWYMKKRKSHKKNFGMQCRMTLQSGKQRSRIC